MDHHFVGLIDANAAGFTSFEFREIDGKINQPRLIFFDHFIIASATDCIASAYTIPALQWTKLGLPCNAAPRNTVESIFGAMDQAGYGNTWVLYSRDASVMGYTLVGNTEALTEGTGYWVYSGDATTLYVSGSAQSLADIDLVGVATTGRDNYIGHNQNVSVDWNKVQVVDGDIAYDHGDYDTLMSRTMSKWNGNVYLSFDGITSGMLGTLEPSDAFWVQAFEPGIKLRIPVPPVPTINVKSTSQSVESRSPAGLEANRKRKGPTRPQRPRNDPWYIRLIASAGTMEDPGNVLGQLATATDGNGPHDLEELSPFGNRYLSILFTNPLFEQVDWGFTSDFRTMTKRPQGIWPFVVKTHAGTLEATIRWEGEDHLFNDTWLIDEQNGEMIRAGSGGSYTFVIEGGEHNFRFEVGD